MSKFLILLFLLFSVQKNLEAADDFDDLFEGVDMSVKPKNKEKPKSIFKQFKENLEKKLLFRSMIHTESPTPRAGMDDVPIFAESRFELKTNWKKGATSVKLLAWIEYGSQDSTYRGVGHIPRDRDSVRRIIELNEFEFIRSFKKFDLTYGKKVIKNGLSTLYSPSDRISPVDLMDPLNPKKFGVWLLGVDYYVKETTWSFKVMPFFTPTKESNASSRWSGTGDSVSSQESLLPSSVSSDSVSATEDYPAIKLKNIQTFLKWKTVKSGWDIFASAYHGPNFYPVLKTDGLTDFITEHVMVGNYASGFSTTHKNFEYHGELFYQYAFHNKDDHYINWLLGTTWTIDESIKFLGVKQLDWTLEYSREELLKDQGHSSYQVSSKEARVSRDIVLTRMLFKINEDLRIAAGFNFDFDERGHMETLGLEYKIKSGLKLYTHVEYLNGNTDTHYGQWRENDRVVSTLEWIF